jgi:hypothetical protein
MKSQSAYTPAAVSDTVDTSSWRIDAGRWLLVVGVGLSVPPVVSFMIWSATDLVNAEIDTVIDVYSMARLLMLVVVAFTVVGLWQLRVLDDSPEYGAAKRHRTTALYAVLFTVALQFVSNLVALSYAAAIAIGVVYLAELFVLAFWLKRLLSLAGLTSWLPVGVGAHAVLQFASYAVLGFRPITAALIGVWMLVETLRIRRAIA